MASACVNRIGISPESLLDSPQKYSSYGWLSPRVSIHRKTPEEDASSKSKTNITSPAKNKNVSDLCDAPDPVKKLTDLTEEEDTKEFVGFEFLLDDTVIMLPADKLFSEGKLIPLHLSAIQPEVATSTTFVTVSDTPYSRRRTDEPFVSDPYLFSPRAPRCSSRWKELLGFRKHNNNNIISNKVEHNTSNKLTSLSSSSQTATGATRSIRQFLNRSSKSSNDSPIHLPLLKDPDNESVTVSSRQSLSSSSSGHDLDDLPRLSLDSDKQGKVNHNINHSYRPKTRMLKTGTNPSEARASTRVGRSTTRRASETTAVVANRGVSIDSPRMNSSGKIVFHSLERSSSSPSNLIGGQRFKHRGMERSYSANVRITPVLNVPVCSLRGSSNSGGVFGFPIFSSQQKREGSSSNSNGGSNRSQRVNGKCS